MLAYQYVPNILAVLYSLVWSWIDFDAKRMQPWFELSKPGGEIAKNSVFLDYQYDFVAWVPFKAAKRRSVLIMSDKIQYQDANTE